MKTYPRIIELFKHDLKNGVPLRGIVRKTKLNSNTIANYLEGLTEPTGASLAKIAAAYGVSIAWLRGDTDDKAAIASEVLSDTFVLYGVDEDKRLALERINKLPDQQVKKLLALMDLLESSD